MTVNVFNIEGATDIGTTRLLNEDFISHESSELTAFTILADGMGGHNAGEVASQYAVQALAKAFKKYLTPGRITSSQHAGELIQNEIKKVNQDVLSIGLSDPDKAGMGCTLVVNFFYDNQLIVAHVGDSRCYLYRDGELIQITKDHSLVQLQIDEGLISEEEARNSSIRNQLIRAIGIGEKICIDMTIISLHLNDLILSCSDGLTEKINNKQLQAFVKEALYQGGIAQYLIAQAKLSGSCDNISVQATYISAPYNDSRPKWLRKLIRLINIPN